MGKLSDNETRRVYKKEKLSFKHSPFVSKGKEICSRLNKQQLRLFLALRRNHKGLFFVKIIKKNIVRAGILSCAAFVSFVNVKSHEGGFLNDNFLNPQDTLSSAAQKIEKPSSLALAPIADADELADYEQFLKEEGEKNTVLSVLTPVSNPTPEEFESSGDDVFVYKVEEGDTVSTIAQKYSINVNTILWANGLSQDSIIKPGDEVFILPVTGLKYKVKDGDTVKSLAKKYEAKEDKIIEFNNLPADGKLTMGEEIVIPDGRLEDQPRYQDAQANRYAKQNNLSEPPAGSEKTYSNSQLAKFPAHSFPYGWCTWYVATKRHVPWGGNAGTWLYHAKAYGAKTGTKPQKGAILVTRESRWGHVAIVEKISGGSITVSEMNYKGWGVKSSRTISVGNPVIKGYIY